MCFIIWGGVCSKSGFKVLWDPIRQVNKFYAEYYLRIKTKGLFIKQSNQIKFEVSNGSDETAPSAGNDVSNAWKLARNV